MKILIAYQTFILATITISGNENEARTGTCDTQYTISFVNSCSNEMSEMFEDHSEVIPQNNCHIYNLGNHYNNYVIQLCDIIMPKLVTTKQAYVQKYVHLYF